MRTHSSVHHTRGGGDGRISGACWPVKLDELLSSTFQWEILSSELTRTRGGEWLRRHWLSTSGAHMSKQTHRCQSSERDAGGNIQTSLPSLTKGTGWMTHRGFLLRGLSQSSHPFQQTPRVYLCRRWLQRVVLQGDHLEVPEVPVTHRDRRDFIAWEV